MFGHSDYIWNGESSPTLPHSSHNPHLGMGSPSAIMDSSWCMTLRVQITKVQADLPQKNSKNLGHVSDL